MRNGKAPNSTTDHSLLRQFRQGEGDAATRLYLRYSARLQSLAAKQTSKQLAARFDPEDVVQSVFRTFFRRVTDGLYDVPPGEELWGLLLVLSLNKVRRLAKHHRAAKRDAEKTAGSETLAKMDEATSYDETSLKTLELVVQELLEKLPEKHRPVVELRMQGHSVDQIAQKSGRAKRTVERILSEFKTTLGGLIEDE